MITIPDAVRRKAAEAGARRARRLAELSGLDPTAIREWSAVERVSTGLTCASIELPVGRELLAAADRLAAR